MQQVGKTHFCANLHGQKYKKDLSTDGIVFSDITVSDTSGLDVEFKILDFAGQEVFFPLNFSHAIFLGVLPDTPILPDKALYLYSYV